jgi:hypothetical protein
VNPAPNTGASHQETTMTTETTAVLDRIVSIQDKALDSTKTIQDRVVELNTKAAAQLAERAPRLADAAGKASVAASDLQSKFIDLSDKGRAEAKERFDAISTQVEDALAKVRERLPETPEALSLDSITRPFDYIEFPSAKDLLHNSRSVAERSIELNRQFAKSVVAAWAPAAEVVAPVKAAATAAPKKAASKKTVAKKTVAKKAATPKSA